MPNERFAKHWIALAASTVFLACAPREQDCRALMPLTGDAVTITSTPTGSTGCTTNIEGVTVTTALERNGVHWRAGQTWVDGTVTPSGDVPAAVAAAKARRDVEARAAAVQATSEALWRKGTQGADKLLERLRKK